MKSYRDKLRDDRWQSKRMLVLIRDGWVCRNCGNDYDDHSEVHHLFYLPGREPWEYHQDDLATLCRVCHQEETDRRRRLEEELLLKLKMRGF